MSYHLQVASAAFLVMHELNMKIKEKKVRRKRRFWRSKLYIDIENRGANLLNSMKSDVHSFKILQECHQPILKKLLISSGQK